MKKAPRNILIIRNDNLGDCIIFSGTLKYYRQLYSNDKISLAVSKIHIPLFEHCPYIDEVIDFKEFSFYKGDKSMYARNRSRLRRLTLPLKWRFGPQWDLVICPIRSVMADALWSLQQLRAKQKIGIVGCSSNLYLGDQRNLENTFDTAMQITKEMTWQHELQTHLDFLQFQGMNEPQTEKDIWPEFWTEGHDHDLDRFDFVTKGEDYTVLNPYTNKWITEISHDHYPEIVGKHGTNTILIVGVKGDYDRGAELSVLLEKEGRRVINLCGQTSLVELVLLIEKANRVITVDTASLHIAIALHKKTYAIVGGGQWGRFFPYNNVENVHWLNEKMDCYQCEYHCKFEDFRCAWNLNLEAVYEKD